MENKTKKRKENSSGCENVKDQMYLTFRLVTDGLPCPRIAREIDLDCGVSLPTAVFVTEKGKKIIVELVLSLPRSLPRVVILR